MIGRHRGGGGVGRWSQGREGTSTAHAVNACSVFWGIPCRAEKSVPPPPSSENGDLVRQEYLATTQLSDGLALTLQTFLQGLGRKDEGGTAGIAMVTAH